MRIAITGDSWAYTWELAATPQESNTATETLAIGLRQLGHQVLTLAKAGASNLESFSYLQSLSEAVDLVIYIQTEPVRDFRLDKQHGVEISGIQRPLFDSQLLFQLASEHRGIIPAMVDHLKTVTYDQLAQWQTQNDTKVLLVGGCSCIPADQVPESLTVAVPSWTELLIGRDRYRDHLFQDTGQWISHEYADLVIRSKDFDLIEEWYCMSRQVMAKTLFWGQNQQYFGPDKWHPNIAGHKVLVRYLDQHYLQS